MAENSRHVSDEIPRLPIALMRYLADSELAVVSWDGTILTLRLTKDIGPEVGAVRFVEVSHVNLLPWLTVAGIECGGSDLLPPLYFETYRPSDQKLDPAERVFLIRGSWGEECFVIAQRVEYEVLS